MNPTVLSVGSALAAAVWSVWTWKEEQHKERQERRDEASALVVNTFLLAAQELQSCLYRILEEDELAFYRKEYPEPCEGGSPHAIGVLYRFSQYFAWARGLFRYGPYTRDARCIELFSRISDAWENRARFPGDAFRFTMEERAGLGSAGVRRIGGGEAPAYESVSRWQFEKTMRDGDHELSDLFRGRAVTRTLAAIDGADRVEALEGRERLVALQNCLVDLLAFVEKREGFRVSLGRLETARLGGGQAPLSPQPGPHVRILHQIPGRLRLEIPRLQHDAACARQVESVLASVGHVRSVRVNVDAACVVVCHCVDVPRAQVVSAIVTSVEEALASGGQAIR